MSTSVECLARIMSVRNCCSLGEGKGSGKSATMPSKPSMTQRPLPLVCLLLQSVHDYAPS